MSIIQNRLVALTQRIKNSQAFKINFENKFQSDRDSNSRFHSKSIKQCNRRNNTTTNRLNQINNSINEN